MASKPLKAYIDSLKAAQAQLVDIQAEWVAERKPVLKARLKIRVDQWTNKCLYLTEQIIGFGTSHSIIEVSGQIWVKEKNSDFNKSRNFTIYFTGLTIQDAKEYFENIVKTKWENIILETISFKSIPVGVIQINMLNFKNH